MEITKKSIFYFSGTGNSLQVAKDIAAELGGIELVSIPKIINSSNIKVQSECIGLVFPVYMWGLPLIVDEFIKKLNFNKPTYVFAVATYGGLPGNALKQVNTILNNKKHRLNAGFTINMPGNYIVMYGERSKKNQQKAFSKEKIEIKKIVEIIKEKKNYGYKKSNILVERVFAPIVYKKIYKVSKMDESFWVKDSCVSCGICEKVCCVNNIEIVNGKPTWKNNCQQCMACIQYCPKQAIEYGKNTADRKRYKNPNITLNEMIDGGKYE
jgi:ferredoxin